MAPNNFGRVGSFSCHTRPHFSIRKKAPTLSRPNRSGISASTTSRLHSRTPGKTGGRKGSRPLFSRILQSPFPCSKEKRLLETSHRLKSVQHVSSQTYFQDGDSCLHSALHQTHAMGGFLGPGRCILPCSYPSQLPEVPALLLSRPGLPVSGDALWIGHGSTSFHQTHGRSERTPPITRGSTASVFRRLALTPARSSTASATPRVLLEGAPLFRTPSQCSQVRPHSLSGFHIRGNEFSDPHQSGQGLTATYIRPPFEGQMGAVPISYHSSRFPLTQRYPELCSRLRAVGTSLPTSSSALSLSSMEMVSRQSANTDSHPSVLSPPPSMVARRGDPVGRSTASSPATFFTSHNGCEHGRLGRSPGTPQPDIIRIVVSSGVSPAHKQSRNASSLSSCFSIPITSSGLLCDGIDRQHISRGLHPETGRDTLSLPVSGNNEITCSLQEPKRLSLVQTHTRSSQRPGGRFVSQTPVTSIGVDTSSGSGQSDIPHIRLSTGRPVCDQRQPQTSSVCESSVRTSSVGGRRAFVRLGSTGRLRLSPTHSNSPNLRENQGELLPDPPDSPLVAQEILVQRPSRSPVRISQGTPAQVRSPISERQTSLGSRHVPLTRLAVIRQSLQKKRFSVRASTLVASARRKSTRAVYDARWKLFSNWCVRGKIDPLNPSARRIADFLIYLFDDKKLSLSSIKGYRSVLSHTLAFRKSSQVCADPAISELIRAMELKRPVSRSLTPKWDLACVLGSLIKAPYEPLNQASLQFLTWKTVFLLTMASSKRRSEIHALSIEESHLRFDSSDGSVTLLCQPGFLAKNQLPSMASKPFKVPSLSRTCGNEDEDRLLCPVRSLKFYLSRVKSIRGSRKRLFIPLKGGVDVSAASISRWVASTIKRAYSSLSSRDSSLFKIRPHELRAMSASWAYINHTPLSDVLQAAFWRNQTTFSSFYLRSLECQQDNLYLLGPLVVAQTVVSSTA